MKVVAFEILKEVKQSKKRLNFLVKKSELYKLKVGRPKKA